MKSLILYGASKKLSHAHKPVHEGSASFRHYEYYVRADLFHGSIDEALANAKPIEGETVLNTVEVVES